MTDEQLTKIRWLGRAFHAEKNARAWLAKLERDRALAERLTPGRSAGGSTGNATETALLRLAETERETQDRLCKLIAVREEIAGSIKSVDDLDMQTILVRRYLAYEKMELIAEKMHYDIRTVQRKHKAALDKLVIECHPNMC